MRRLLLLLVLVAAPLAAQNVPCFTPAVGALTDCGANGGTYPLRAEIAAPSYADAHTKGQERWGPCYSVADGTNGCYSGQPNKGSKCIVSEADNALTYMWAEVHGCQPSWQEAQDMGLILGLDRQIEREYCNKVGPCTAANAYVVTKDTDTTWATGKAPAGTHPGNCPAFQPTQKPCGLQTAWNCFWGHNVYVDNRAPHCGGTAPAPPTPPAPPAPPAPAPLPVVDCQPVPVEIFAWANRTCDGAEWTAAKIGGARHRQLCQQRDRIRAYRPVLESTGQSVMTMHPPDGAWAWAPLLSGDASFDGRGWEGVSP